MSAFTKVYEYEDDFFLNVDYESVYSPLDLPLTERKCVACEGTVRPIATYRPAFTYKGKLIDKTCDNLTYTPCDKGYLCSNCVFSGIVLCSCCDREYINHPDMVVSEDNVDVDNPYAIIRYVSDYYNYVRLYRIFCNNPVCSTVKELFQMEKKPPGMRQIERDELIFKYSGSEYFDYAYILALSTLLDHEIKQCRKNSKNK